MFWAGTEIADVYSTDLERLLGDILVYGSGSVFAFLLLAPYMTRDSTARPLRVTALLVVGAVSYYFAMHVANGSWEWLLPDEESFPGWLPHPSSMRDWQSVYAIGLAGIYGAIIVGLGVDT